MEALTQHRFLSTETCLALLSDLGLGRCFRSQEIALRKMKTQKSSYPSSCSGIFHLSSVFFIKFRIITFVILTESLVKNSWGGSQPPAPRGLLEGRGWCNLV